MRILCLTKYPERGPSSRYRVYQFLPHLEAAGIEVHVDSLHDDGYLDRMLVGARSSTRYLVVRALKRLVALVASGRFDLIFVQKELFPYLPGFVESGLTRLGRCLVLDLDDAVYLQYDREGGWWRRRLRQKFPSLVRDAALVLAGNRTLERYARQYSSRVAMFPTVVDLSRFPVSPSPADNDVPVLGWIGTPATVGYLDEITPALRRLAERQTFRLRVIGGDGFSVPGLDVESVTWSEDTEIAELSRFDIGLMPLDGSPWSEGKCGLKLLQYMGMGVASVSSPRGTAAEIVIDGDNGMLAEGGAEWEEKLAALLDDSARRTAIGAAGRQWVETHYNLERYGPRLVEHLRGVLPPEV